MSAFAFVSIGFRFWQPTPVDVRTKAMAAADAGPCYSEQVHYCITFSPSRNFSEQILGFHTVTDFDMDGDEFSGMFSHH